jgi:hypothetical protein
VARGPHVARGALCRGPPAVFKKITINAAHYITVCGQIDASATFLNYVYVVLCVSGKQLTILNAAV